MMHVWNEVRTGFNPADETQLFGPRTCVESDGFIYESTTQATISTGSEVHAIPRVTASVHSSGVLCVGVDKNLIVFASSDSSLDCCLNIEFSSIVDCFALSQDGTLLFACVKDEGVECYSIAEKKGIFKRCLKAEGEAGISFVNVSVIERDDECEVLIAGSTGYMFRLVLRNLTNHVEAQNINDDIELLYEKLLEPAKVFTATTLTENNEIKILQFSELIKLWRNDELIDFVSVDEEIIKVQQLQQSRYIVGLTSTKKLITICPYSLQLCYLNEEMLVEDFVVLESSFGKTDPVILILEKNSKEGKMESHIHFALFPSFEIKYSIDVAYTSYLVDIPQAIQEIFYVEGSSTKKSCIDTLNVKILAQGIPEFRLDHLLRRGLFTEAKQFAIVHGLDVETVYKSEAIYIAQQNTSDANTLLEVLHDITDVHFIVECCSKAAAKNLHEIRQLLEYSRSRLTSLKTQTLTSDVELLLSEVNSVLLRLDTYEILNQCSGTEVDDWIVFSKADLFEKCTSYLSQGNFMKAAILWNRYVSSFKKRLSPAVVVDVLRMVPQNVQMENLAPFLQFFVPLVLQICPQSVDGIVDWAFEKVRHFELKKSCWLENAVHFLERLSSLVNLQKGSVTSSFAQYSAAKTRILHMVNSLKDLKELQKKYNVHMKLNDFVQENKQKVAECILNNTTLHHLRSIIKDFLKQYFLKNNLNADYVLLHYTQNLANYSCNYYQDSSWENTVSVISGYIQNIEDRIECILYIIKKASVPWSTAIAEMAEAGANLKHPRASDIRYEQISVKSKLILKKYGIVKPSQQDTRNTRVSLDNIHYVIKQDRDEMHSDVVQLMEASPQLKSQAYLYLANFYMEKGCQKEAFATVEMLDKDLLVELCEKMVYKIDYFLQSELLSDISSNYITALGYIVNKYGNELAELRSIPVQELKNMHTLKCEFGMAVKLDQYVSERFRKDVIRKYTLRMLKSNFESYDSMKYDLERLTYLLQFSYEEGFLVAAQQACDEKELDVARLFAGCVAGRPFYLTSTSEELMCVTDTLIVSEKRHEKDEDDFYLVERLTSNACCFCPSDELNKWLDEFQWSGLMCNNNDIAVTTDTRNSIGCSELNNGLLETIYMDRPLFSQHGALHKLIAEMFLICKKANLQEMDAEASCVFRNYYKCLREDLCEVTMLKVLLNIYYKVLQCRKNELFDVEANIILAARTLLHRILKFRKLDRTMGVALLCINNENSVQELTDASKTFAHDCVRLGALAELAVAFAEIVECSDIMTKFYQTLIGCKWIKTLVKFKIPYKEAYKHYSSGSQHMFRALISVDSFSTQLVEEFCNDFHLDVEDYLTLYLETLILSWKPQVEVTVNPDGSRGFSVKNSEEPILKKGKEIIEKITLKERVRTCLQKLYYKINYYNYEMFMCVNVLMNHDDFQNEMNDEHQLLCFLKRYQRLRQPNQQEKDDWFDKYPDACELPTIAEFRLPFRPLLENPLRIVKTELNLKTYKTWFNVARTLRLDLETICTLAAKNSITEEFSTKLEASDNSWCLTVHHTDFLKELVACLKYCQDLEKACAVLYYATNHMPAGADQVMAAELCYNTAVRWGEQDSLENNAKNCIRKVQQKYQQLQAVHVLHKYGLGNDAAILNFISNPQQLIAALFRHPAIVNTSARHCPDINGAIEDLAKLFRINSISLRKEQLKELLMPHSMIEAELLDNTVTDNFMQSDTQAYKNIDEESLLRACYLLQVDKDEELVNYLVNIVISDTSDGVTSFSRLRALQCLLSTVSLSALEKLFGKDEMYIRSLTKNLTYVSKLEVLGMRYSLYSFETCNKIDLVSRVWRMCSEKSLGLTLVADLCLEYGIFELKWWDPLLKSMVKFHMMLELEEYLPQLTEHSHIMGCSGLIQAWNYIIIQPFIKAEFPLTNEQKLSCFESLVKLQTCPVINYMKFEEIFDHCLRTKILHMAAAILPLLRSDQHRYVQKILANSDASTLKENLCQLQNQGILTAQQAIQILGIQ
ncbi:uncharacterized protein LOC126235494 [Schistocerca nitens]|uniref:uncharacterized protein LOC126235494 n=1 Tax=Schistocerca nitens TaxID=7011 RepID=UPI002118FD3F|nr:uncharacterized protein LOC126235494 [Schistocerca nitens]